MTIAGSSTPLLGLDAVVLDTETTSLDAKRARLLQIGAVQIRDGQVVSEGNFDELVNPGEPIPAASTRIHGITDAMAASASPFAAVAPRLEQFIGSRIVIGHTISYDLAVLAHEYKRARLPLPQLRALDIRMLTGSVAPSLADYSLDRICDWLGITIQARHTAIGDAEATARAYLALVPLLRQVNIRTLAEAEAASRARADADARALGGLASAVSERMSEEARSLARLDSFPYRHRVREVMSAPAVFAPPGSPVRDVMRLIIERRISSVLVTRDDGSLGIVTERDLLRAIDRDGALALEAPIGPLANGPLQTVQDAAFLYRAIGRIERLGLRHLGVRDAEGGIVGMVTTRNLLRHRATTAIVLGDDIESAQDARALGLAWAKLPDVARSLLDDQVDPLTIAAVISSEIRIMTRRAAQLAEQHMRAQGHGEPPAVYVVLVLGSAGRGESQLAADQDNAIVYAGEAGEDSEVDRYFATLAEHMCATLDAAGIPFCKGGVMAKNRTWRMSAADWRRTVDGWVRRQRPQDLLNVDIFFDAVPVHGAHELAEDLFGYAYQRAGSAPDFLKLLSETARRRASPFTLLGGMKRDQNGRLDLKMTGLLPIVSAARVLSIRHGVRARSTVERLAGVREERNLSAALMDTIAAAQRTLLGAVLEQQLADIGAGVSLSPRIATARLTKSQSAALKSALRDVDEAIGLVSEGLI